MTTERVERRLAAVLAADVASYSRLMGIDEEGTLARLKAVRKTLVDPTIAGHRGRIVKTTGDGMLIEFASAVDAVRGAVEVQRGMVAQNVGLPQDQRIEFRIGIHVGDIIFDDDDIFGDGVNIAARLEGIAEPGGVCISDDAQRQVRGKVDIAFADMGLHNLKNIAEPMRAWRVQFDGSANSTVSAKPLGEPAQPNFAFPDKPSIAVLPFQNMSGDPEQEYFADGMVEDIITALSRFKSLFVIARNSSFTYKGKAVDIKQVGRELGVRYVLEGSIRKAAGRVRITGQLIEAATGAHLWADRFEGSLEDVFGLQDKVTEQVVAAIQPEVDLAEVARANKRSKGSIDAVSEHYRGIALVTRPSTAENNDTALRHFQNAIEIDPSYAPPYGGSATCLMWRRNSQWPGDKDEDDARLLRLANQVRDLGTDDAYTLATTGAALFHNGVDYDGGSDLVKSAVRLNPNLALAYHSRGYLRVWSGLSDAAIADFERNMRLNPRDPLTFLSLFGIAFGHYNAGRYAEAASWADKSIREFPFLVGGLVIAIVCYVEAGRMDDAERTMSALLRLAPGSNSRSVRLVAFRFETLRSKFRQALLKAGLPNDDPPPRSDLCRRCGGLLPPRQCQRG